MECEICKQSLKSVKALMGHLRYQHNNMPSKEYYDQFIRKPTEGLCLFCKKPTKYISIGRGYRPYCSARCVGQDPKNQLKAQKTCLEKFGEINAAKSSALMKKRAERNKEKWGETNPMKTSKGKAIRQAAFDKIYGGHPSWDPLVKENIKQICQVKFGGDSPFNAPDFLEKRQKTWDGIYEGGHPMKDPAIKKDRQETCMERYGVDNPMFLLKVQAKKEDTFRNNHDGLINPFQLLDVREKAQKVKEAKRFTKVLKILELLGLELLEDYQKAQHIVEFKCLKCGSIFSSCLFNLTQGYGKCTTCFPRTSSLAEIEIQEYIKSIIDEDIVVNDRLLISPQELDIYIPSKKIAIEFNGLYWHSEALGKGRKYHLKKLELCEARGIRLIQIFEDEWYHSKQDIVKKRLAQLLGVSKAIKLHARKCDIREIEKKEVKDKNDFLEKYHLQGKDSSKIKLGAYCKDELVAVMTFSKGNPAKGSRPIEGVWELNRFCTNYNYHIPGIASKLLTFFQKNYEYKRIFSYADRRWSVGNLYYQLGFKLDKITSPNYWYFKPQDKIREYRYNHKKDANDPKDISESILRAADGYTRIWDCGHLKFVLDF